MAGFFWFGVSFGVVTTRLGWWVWGVSTAFQVGVTVAILWAAVRLRRASGFSAGDLWRGSRQQRAETERIVAAFRWTTLGQAVLIAAAAWWCNFRGANDLVWPSIGVITSLHFIPLARFLHVRPYYVTALAGSLISFAAFAGLSTAHRLAWFGGSMAAVMWLSAWYVTRNANHITAQAVHETWAV